MPSSNPLASTNHHADALPALGEITGLDVRDVRFPTSRELDGSDAMNPLPDYSAAYLTLQEVIDANVDNLDDEADEAIDAATTEFNETVGKILGV